MERIPPLLEQGDAWLEVRPAGSSDHEPPSFRQAVQGSAFMSIDKPWNVALHMGSNRNVGDKTPTKQETGASLHRSNDLTQTPSRCPRRRSTTFPSDPWTRDDAIGTE